MGWDCHTYKSYWLRDHFLLVARSDHTTGSRNTKPEVVFKVQKMALYASFFRLRLVAEWVKPLAAVHAGQNSLPVRVEY